MYTFTNCVEDNWVTVPTNSTLTIHKQTVMIHPIIDQYYNESPSYTRSSGFAVSKGLVSNAPGLTTTLAPAKSGGITPDVDESSEVGKQAVSNARLEAVQRKVADGGCVRLRV